MAFTKEEFIKITSSLTGSNAPKEDDKKKKKKDAEPSYLDYADQIVQRYREEEGAREKAPSLQSPLQTAAYQAVDRSRSGFSFDAFKSGMQDIKSWAPYNKLQVQQKLKNTYDNTASGIRKLKTAADDITSAYRQQQAQTAVPQNVPRESDLISLQTRMKSLEQSMSQDIGRFSQYAPPYAQNTGDTRYKRSQASYNDLKSQYQQASRDYNAARYSAMRNNPDFEEYSKRGAGMDNTAEMIAARSGPSFMTSAPSGAPERYRVRYLPDPTKDLGNDAYDYLSDDELATYNYLVAKDAEDGTQEAEKYLSFMLPELNRRKMTLVAQDAAEFAEKYPVTASAASLITSPLAGLGTLYSYGAAALGQDVDPNSPLFAPAVVSDTMRGTVSENISKLLDDSIGEGVGDVGSFLYQTGLSILDFLSGAAATGSGASKLGSGIYLTNTGLRAAASTIQDAYARGATQEQALKVGAMAGIAEILFEKISLDRFVELSNSPLRTSIIKDVLAQGGVEASEEMFTEIANIFFDEHIMGNLSDWRQRVQAYMAQGMTESEASTKAWTEAAKQVALAGLGGFLSGAVTGSVASIGRGRSPKQVMSVGQSLIDEGSASNLIDAALQLDEGTSARKAAQTIVDRGMQSSALDIGNLAYMYFSETGDAEYIYGLDEPTVEETQNEPVATDINEAQDSRAVDLLTVAEEAVQRQNKPVSADIGNSISETVSAVEEQTAADEVRPGETAVMPKAKTPGLLRKYSQDAFKQLPRDVQKKSRDQFYALDLIAKKYGVTIEVVDTIDVKASSGKVMKSAANGRFDPDTGRITIALDSVDNAYMFIGMHELTHYVQQYNADEYAILEDIVLDSLGADTVNEAIKHQISINKGLTEAQARAEVVANSVGAILTDEQTVQRLVGEQRSLAQRIVDFVKKLVADLKEIAQNLSRRKSFEQIESLSKDIETLQSIADAFESALEGASRNVNAAADMTSTEIAEATEFSDVNVKYSLRDEPDPEKTITGYKVFVVFDSKPGELYPPMVANPGGAPTPVGVWLNADEGVKAPDSKTGRKQVKAGGKGTQGGSGSLAYRPGWHLGELPIAQQFARTNPETGRKELFPANFVWAECLVAADVDYQEEAMSYGYNKNGKFQHSLAGLPRLPREADGTAGYYRYRTNPNPDTPEWIITGAMKVNRILTDAETDAILRESGIEPMKRQGGPIDLEKFGLKAGPVETENTKKPRYSRKDDTDGEDAQVNLLEGASRNVNAAAETETETETETQYSAKPQVDSEGNELSTQQAEYFKNSKVRDENGHLRVVYHGTFEDFTVFDKTRGRRNMDIQGMFFSPWDDDAKGYGPKVGAYYINLKNPAPESVAYNALKRFAGQNEAGVKAREYLEGLGYDGVNNSDEEYIAFSPEQIKSVTNRVPTDNPDIRYSTKDDTDGEDAQVNLLEGDDAVEQVEKKPVPQQKRILQKITFSTDPKWLENQYYKLSKENAQLKTVVENLRKEFKLTAKGEYKADRKSVKALAQKFVQEVYSDYDVETLTDELTPLYEKMGRMTQDDWANADIDALIAPFINISANVLQMQSPDIITGVADEIRGMIEYIKNSKITVSSDSEIESTESVRAFRQATGGNINVVKGDVMRDGGVSAYEFIVGFAEEYPGIVPQDIMYGHTSEILNWLAGFVQYEPDYRYLGTDEQLREEATTRAFDLYLAFNTDVKQYKTFADVKKEQRDRLRKQYQDAMKKLKTRMDEKRDAALAKQKKDFDKAMDKAKAEHSAKIAELSKQYAKEKDKAVKAALREQYLELTRLKNAERYFERRAFEEWKIGDKRERKRRQERNKYIKHIKKMSNELASWVNNPTKDHHVPMFLQGPLFDVLNNISQSADPDTSTEKNWQVKLYNLASAANKAVNGKMADEQRTELYDLLPDDIKAELDGLYSTLSTRKEAAEMSGKQTVTLMNNDELGTLYNILKVMRHVIVNINKLHKNTQYKEVKALGDQTIVDAQAFPMAKYGNMASRLLKFDMADAYSYFHQLGKSGDSIIKALSDGQEQKFSRVKEASEFFAAALKKHGIKRGDISKWRSTAHTFKLESGKTVTMTTAHIMELYASMRREQAVKHILGGGIEIDASAGDMRDAIKNRQVGSYKVTSEDVSTMLSKLTAGQKAFMGELQSFLSTTVAEWGNETSMELYGYQKFTEDSYWPIRVTKANIELKDPDKVRAVNAIANAGFTKPTNFYASNPLVLGDPIQKFSGHVSEMAAYNGLAAPIQDAMKWVNYVQRDSKGKPIYNNSVKLMLDKVYGVGGLAYFTNLIKDINGLSQAGYSTEIPRAWTARFKRAAIAGSIRVVIQQPTAILRALSMIDGKYMVMGAVGGANIKEMQEHSPIAWWKSNGHFDIGIGRGDYSIITGDESWSRRFTGEFMKPAGWADDIAWGLLWNAVKAEIRDTKPDMKDGSEDFFKAVSSRFSDIVNRTQVVDTVLHRSQAMRSKDLLMGMATSFMSEPTKQFNMLRTAFIDAKRGNSASAKKQLLRTIFSMALAAGMNGLVKSLWDAARKREKDEDYWKKFEEVLGQNMLDEAILDLPFLKDAISIIQGYDVERLDLSAFGDLWASLKSIYKYIEQGVSKKSMYKLFADLVKSVSSMTGLPFRGLLTSFESVLNMFAPEALTAKFETVKNLYDAYRTGDKKVAAELYNAILSENIKKIENAEKERKKEGEIPVYADAESIRVGAMEQIDSALAKLLAEEPEIAEAYGYRKAGQAKKLDAIYEKLLAQGFTRNTITQAINRYQNIVEKSQPETDEYSEKKRYKNEHLFTAIRGAVSSGNYSDVALIYDELLKTSSAKDPKKAIRNEVTQEFKAEYVSYFDSGNSSKAQSLAKVLKTHFGYEDEDFAKWVMDDKSDKMRDAINSGDAKTANKYIQRQLQLGRDAEDIAQSVTAKYKAEIIDAFIANDKTKLQALFGTLAALSLTDKKGNPYYTWDRVWGWIENYLENPE
jgi:hypothetical protein